MLGLFRVELGEELDDGVDVKKQLSIQLLVKKPRHKLKVGQDYLKVPLTKVLNEIA